MRISQEEIEKFRKHFEEKIPFEDEEIKIKVWKDQLRIHKKFNSKKTPKMRLLWEYLQKNITNCPLDKKIISKELLIPKSTIDQYLSELNRYVMTRGIRWFHTPKRKDFIQVVGFNPRETVMILKERESKTLSEIIRTEQTRFLYEQDKKELDMEYRKQKAKKKEKEVEPIKVKSKS